MAKRLTLKQIEHFHRNKRKIPSIILSKTEAHEVIHGARALNKHLPKFLDKPTEDYDIFSRTPKKDARQIEKALDKSFGGDFFFTESAIHKGTHRVKDRVRKSVVADYTKPKKKIPHKKIGGKNYAKLSHIKKHIKKTLKDKEAKYRHDEDRDALNRIRIHERLKKRKR